MPFGHLSPHILGHLPPYFSDICRPIFSDICPLDICRPNFFHHRYCPKFKLEVFMGLVMAEEVVDKVSKVVEEINKELVMDVMG